MMLTSLQVAILAVFVGSTLAVSTQCVQGKNCRLPDCFCSTFKHPKFSNVKDIPQMVYFGFDDAVTVTVDAFYRQLFSEARRNPNGCPITMSLYVQNQWTDYNLVSSEYQYGNEIASHSVTHVNVDTRNKMIAEAGGQKDNLVSKAHVPREEVVGWRSPNLKPAGDDQPEVLKSQGYIYDISLSYTRKSINDPVPWPYTLDYGYPFNCAVTPCPGKNSSHAGFWEIPINPLYDSAAGHACTFVDSCRPKDEAAALDYLWSNFKRTYEGNRAPFGFNMHAAWFVIAHNLKATHAFLDKLQELDDVYVISAKQVLDWMKSPVKVSEAHKVAGWGCPNPIPRTTANPALSITTTVKPTTTVQPETSASGSGGVLPSVCIQEVNCRLPTCLCRSYAPPARLPLNKTPQMIVLTFMGPVDSLSYPALTDLLNSIPNNPNGCPISATFFRPYTGNNDQYLEHLRSDGHEMAMYGTRPQDNKVDVNKQLSSDLADFKKRSSGTTGKINLGYRSSHTSSIGKDMLKTLNASGVLYDSSMVMYRTVSQRTPSPWPYTLDFGWQDRCSVGINCPTDRSPGLWEVPIIPLTDYKEEFVCVYPDGCYNQPLNASDTRHLFALNFFHHLHTNRVPMGIHLRKNWLSHAYHRESLRGLKEFLTRALSRGDVYVVSMQKMLDWMRQPTSLDRIGDLYSWQC